FSLMLHHHSTSTPFPYTTLFRSATKAFEKNGARSVAKSSPLGPKLRGSLRGPIIVGPVLAPVPVPPRHVDELIEPAGEEAIESQDRKSTRLNSSHLVISYAVFCL